MRALLVEDNKRLLRVLSQALADEGMVLDTAVDGQAADQLLCVAAYDVVVLDLALPRLDGLQVLQRARARGNDVPVLILTASGDTADRVSGLNAGADDYLPKPFDLAELTARLRALARRRAGHSIRCVHLGRLSYDTVARHFQLHGRHLALPPREFQILEVLLLNAGRPLSKTSIRDQLCSLDDDMTAEAIEVYVHRLRKRLDDAGLSIRTLRGLGYLMEPAPMPARAPA